MKGIGCADKNTDFLGTGDTGIDEVALQHDVVVHHDGTYMFLVVGRSKSASTKVIVE